MNPERTPSAARTPHPGQWTDDDLILVARDIIYTRPPGDREYAVFREVVARYQKAILHRRHPKDHPAP